MKAGEGRYSQTAHHRRGIRSAPRRPRLVMGAGADDEYNCHRRRAYCRHLEARDHTGPRCRVLADASLLADGAHQCTVFRADGRRSAGTVPGFGASSATEQRVPKQQEQCELMSFSSWRRQRFQYPNLRPSSLRVSSRSRLASGGSPGCRC